MFDVMWTILLTLFVLFCILVEDHAVVWSQQEKAGNDLRIVSYEVLSKEVITYAHPDIQGFSQLTPYIPEKELFIGARNYLLRLSLESLKEIEVVQWKADERTKEVCKAKGQSEQNCQNFISSLLIHQNRVFTCGTNAFSPICTWRSLRNLREVAERINGIAKSPFHPDHNSTALMTADGNFYSATATDFTARDPAIYRIMGPGAHLRTVQFNIMWLNEPNFVSSYEIGNYIYYFFRETAVEYLNCGKSVYSRVARVCKNDPGGDFLLEDTWTTFVKARLNCSMPGNYPFYFNELQSTHYSEDDGVIYGVFNTPRNSIHGSAICVFNLTAMDRAFSGPYKYLPNTEMAWQTHPNSLSNTKCSGKKPDHSILVNAQKYQLMELAVQPLQVSPFFRTERESWSHIVVDKVRAKHHLEVNVVFVVSLTGILKKIAKLPYSRKACLIEEIHLTPKNRQKPIKAMKLIAHKGSIIISFDDRILKVPVQRCWRYKTKESCTNAMDPYCGWNNFLQACTPPPDGETRAHFWHQEYLTCPDPDYAANGHWSDWSPWSVCDQTGNQTFGDKCLCRSRSCNNPPPRHGGKYCKGVGAEVTNCTVNGKWTEWTEWSQCSGTCGSAFKTRTRNCANPHPAFGGKYCAGSPLNETWCNVPLCPAPKPPPVDGGWSKWTPWTDCSERCDGGIQIRNRTCNNPPPFGGGKQCYGDSLEYKECNKDMCLEYKKSTPWTPWMISPNKSRKGESQIRFRFVCKANVPDGSKLRNGHVRSETRLCPHENACMETVSNYNSVDGGWSDWSSWSKCSNDCGGGKQFKERTCNNPSPTGTGQDCEGKSAESRSCNMMPCKGFWSCWTEWSACSVTCGAGVHYRKRQCLHMGRTSGKQLTSVLPCMGSDLQQEECSLSQCETMNFGWREWTTWSPCMDSFQKRKRKCAMSRPRDNECLGENVQTRMCEPGFNFGETASIERDSSKRFEVFHLVIVGIIAFIIGGIVSVAIFLYVQHSRHVTEQKNNKENEKKDKEQRDAVTVNEQKLPMYMSPSNTQGSLVLNSSKFSNNSLANLTGSQKDKMTDKNSSLKRSSLHLRTNLSLNDL
ncbi:semaphorin-5A-like isoform X2 [Lineus longissimus]|uniref:semaphorin-5A-like isoform X2 n=1 Tax=Lineus longissimus TaxID=88925 RepID=UPI00315C4EAE